MENLRIPALFVLIPTYLAAFYWACHNPGVIRFVAEELQGVVHRLNAWAKAQDSRKSSYQRAMKRHRAPSVPKAQPTQEVTEC